jgi:hypothetical protein
MSPPRYPSDLSDEEWTILAPLLFDRKARPSAEVAAEARRGRRLLPAQERMFVADVTP